MITNALTSAVFVLFGVTAVSAQSDIPATIALPGSINANVGSLGSLEPGNVVGSTNVEQGVTIWRRGSMFVAGFGDVALKNDTLGYSWNNNVTYLTGSKLVIAGSYGVLQAVAGVTGVLRSQTSTASVSPSAHVAYWAGWQRYAGGVQLPGSVWATSGITAATEPDNWITSAHAEQGIAVKRFNRAAIVPFAAATATSDTRDRPWNNRGFLDGGVKVSTRAGSAVIDVGVAQRVTRPWRGGSVEAAPVAFVNMWMGWMPRIKR